MRPLDRIAFAFTAHMFADFWLPDAPERRDQAVFVASTGSRGS